MALDLLHKKNNTDLITGLRAKTNPGRPDWDQASVSLRSYFILQRWQIPESTSKRKKI